MRTDAGDSVVSCKGLNSAAEAFVHCYAFIDCATAGFTAVRLAPSGKPRTIADLSETTGALLANGPNDLYQQPDRQPSAAGEKRQDDVKPEQ